MSRHFSSPHAILFTPLSGGVHCGWRSVTHVAAYIFYVWPFVAEIFERGILSEANKAKNLDFKSSKQSFQGHVFFFLESCFWNPVLPKSSFPARIKCVPQSNFSLSQDQPYSFQIYLVLLTPKSAEEREQIVRGGPSCFLPLNIYVGLICSPVQQFYSPFGTCLRPRRIVETFPQERIEHLPVALWPIFRLFPFHFSVCNTKGAPRKSNE